MPIGLSESNQLFSVYDMKGTLSHLTLDFRSLRLALFIISIEFMGLLVLVSTDGSINITDQVIASTSNGEGEEEEESESSDESSEGVHNFVVRCEIDSVIYTKSGNWHATGPCKLSVVNGEVSSFDANMIWNNSTATQPGSTHSHEFRNFQGGDDVVLSPDNSTTFDGLMDVATNKAISWPQVSTEVNIDGGKIMTVTVDDEETDNHFYGQSIHGTVKEIVLCNARPAAGMQIVTDCT
jgi:hypothetical protein